MCLASTQAEPLDECSFLHPPFLPNADRCWLAAWGVVTPLRSTRLQKVIHHFYLSSIFKVGRSLATLAAQSPFLCVSRVAETLGYVQSRALPDDRT